jgi:hypothetical protein
MTKRMAIVMAVVIATGWIAIVCYGPRSREPSYDGRPLSDWLNDLYQNSHLYFPTNDPLDEVMGPGRNRAALAVRSIGTNAVPFLVSMLRAKDSGLKQKFVALARKHSLLPIPRVGTPECWRCALMGFSVLRPAWSAKEDLVKIALDERGEQRTLALAALHQIDPQCYRDTSQLIAAQTK